MKSVRFLLTFFMLAAVPVVGLAAPKPKTTSDALYKADLSSSIVPGVKTPAVGEAVFLPTSSAVPGVAGAGAGGGKGYSRYSWRGGDPLNGMSAFGTAVPGDSIGDSGPGQGFDQGGSGTMYEGFVNPDPNNTGSSAIGTARGDWGMPDDRPAFWSDASPDYTRHAGVGVTGYGAGGTTRGAAAIIPDSLSYMISANNISDVSGAYLQMGKPGSGGPVIATLFSGPKEGPLNGLLTEGTITNSDLTGPMAGKSLNDLVSAIKKGDVYVNVVSAAHPTGEIGGLVRPVS